MDRDFLDDLAADLGLDEVSTESLQLPNNSAVKTDNVSNKNSLNNAERCKRHRQRKREKELQTYTENINLKKERMELKQKICALEFEVQALRGQGVMDFTKENELLKAEIKQHREYVDRVVAVALGTPLEVDNLETLRLVQSAVESAAAQVVGLCYSSVNSTAWSRAIPVKFPVEESMQELYGLEELPDMETLYQYLPMGSTPETALRINMRSDINLPVSMEEVFTVYWHFMSDVSIVEAQLNKTCDRTSCSVREVYPKTTLADNEEVLCFAVERIIDDKTKATVLAAGAKEVEMYSLAFPSKESETEPIKAKIAVCTCCNVVPENKKEDGSENVEYLQAMSVEAAIFRDLGNGKSSLTLINSEPCTGGFHELLLPGVPVIDSDGKLADIFMDTLRVQVNSMLKMLSVHREGNSFPEKQSNIERE